MTSDHGGKKGQAETQIEPAVLYQRYRKHGTATLQNTHALKTAVTCTMSAATGVATAAIAAGAGYAAPKKATDTANS